MTGPMLVVIRGNSGSGKTTTAREVRRRYDRGCALIELSDRSLGVRDVGESDGC
jgi:uridine kinase